MKNGASYQKTIPKALVLTTSFVGSLIFSLLIFYFDEGRNSFNGIFESENLAALAFYFVPMLGFTILLCQILKKYLRKIYALAISALFGPAIGFSVVIGIFMVISKVL